jgi:hypothetical protein
LFPRHDGPRVSFLSFVFGSRLEPLASTNGQSGFCIRELSHESRVGHGAMKKGLLFLAFLG